MDTEEMKRLAADPRFISGIYNYCDRWCERCPFTSRCLTFAMGKHESQDPASRDPENEAFWHELSAMFEATLDLLREMAEREGVDLDSLNIEEAEEQEQYKREVVQGHLCCRAAESYRRLVDDWFVEAAELFGRRDDAAGRGHAPSGEGTAIEEAVQVIRWYQPQICVKLMRAVRGSLEERPDVLEEFPSDADGSAKVALIGMDRSLPAWERIRELFPMLDRAVVDIMMHLEGLRRETEKAFPGARGFIRPGFDRIDLNS